MFIVLILLLVGIFSWVIGGVVLHRRRRIQRKMALMRRVETSAAAIVSGTAPGTLVEVKGTLRCENPLTSEMAEQTCAYYLSQVMRVYETTSRDADGDWRTSQHSDTVASNERFAPFVVEDESGTIGVRGEGAEVDALEVMNRFENGTGEGRSITLGGSTVNLRGGRGTTIGYRYVESVLPLDSPVYVLGAVHEDGEIGALPPQDEEGRFLISYRSEEQLEKNFEREVRLHTLGAVVLFLFGLPFVAVGVAVGVAVLLG